MRADLDDQLHDLLREVLDRPEMVMTDELSADDLDAWDSLAHIDLMVAIEETFGVRFSSDEFMTLRRVGDLHKRVRELTS